MMIGLIDSVSLGIAGCFFPTKLGMEDEGRIDVMHTHRKCIWQPFNLAYSSTKIAHQAESPETLESKRDWPSRDDHMNWSD